MCKCIGKLKREKPVVCIDFDGVLNNYKFYDPDNLFDMRPGAYDFIMKLSVIYRVVILTARDTEKVNAGQVADMNRIRSHMLRKFHASRLYNDGLSIDKIDALQGRAKDNTHKAYFKESPEALKELYIEHMDAIRVK